MSNLRRSNGLASTSAGLTYIVSVFLLSVADAAGKWLTSAYPIGQIVFVRCIVASLTSGVLSRPRIAALCSLAPSVYIIHALRGGIICIVNYMFFWGAGRIPLANAVSIFLIGTLLASLGGCLLSKEGRLLPNIACNTIALLGTFFVLNPSRESELFGGLLVLLSAFGYAVGMLLANHAVTIDDERNVSLLGNLSAAFFAAVTLPFAWQQPTYFDLKIFLLVGVSAGLATTLSVFALHRGKLSTLILADYSIVLWGVSADYVLWSKLPEFTMVFGAALIIGASLANAIFSRERKRV